MARLTRFKSTLREKRSTGMRCTLIPRYFAPLSKAACADEGIILLYPMLPAYKISHARRPHISGSLMPLTVRAQSRYVFTDMMMDSVPPEVMVPAPSGLLYNRKHMETISASILRIAGNTSGCRGLDTQYRWYAATMTFSRSSPPSVHNH